jgi:hypothetical protein
MKRIVIIITLAATFAVADQVAHAAAPIRDCEAYNKGGGFVNLTTRNDYPAIVAAGARGGTQGAGLCIFARLNCACTSGRSTHLT